MSVIKLTNYPSKLTGIVRNVMVCKYKTLAQ